MKKSFVLLMLSGCSFFALSQDLSLYSKHYFIQGRDTLPYRLLLPENYNPKEKYPLLLFLHGAGERGKDNEKQLIYGATLFLREDIRKKYPTIIIFPQCPENSYWSNVDIREDSRRRVYNFREEGEATWAMYMLQELVQRIVRDYPIQKKRVYVGGLSMGGMGTFEIVNRNPKLFAAAFPICGGGSPAHAPNMTKVKWWVFHGAKDDVVPPEKSQKMVSALRPSKASVRFTLYPEANHNSWDAALAEPELLSWLYSQEK